MAEFIHSLGYSPSVRIGNWFEELCEEEDEIQEFLQKKERGELALQKTRKLFSTFFKEVSLPYMKKMTFGKLVQLIPTRMKVCHMYQEYKPALSIVVHEKTINESQQISDRCELTIAPSVKPCLRNTFRIRSADSMNRDNQKLNYGQGFMLECVEAEKSPLVIFSSPKTADLNNVISTSYKCINDRGEENLPVGLCLLSNAGAKSRIPTGHCVWKCYHKDPNRRNETEGTAVNSNEELVIAHNASNQFLSAENYKISTLFGTECLVSAHTYNYVHRKWQNYWMLGTVQK